jgi:sugar phosphate isomerase/epimerase
MIPKIATCDIFPDLRQVRTFALAYGFSGIDYSFELDNVPTSPSEESIWTSRLAQLAPLEVRFHCPFLNIDLGHHLPEKAKAAEVLFQRIIGLVSKAGGQTLSIHIGLGRDSTAPLSWEATTANLRNLVQFGARCGVKICLENLAWGWTSKPNLFEKLVRGSGAWVTFDLGHAQVCEAVSNQYYTIEDFVTPHSDRVINAHIYHEEIPGFGHVPPDHLKDIEDRLSLLMEIGCEWWVIEIKHVDGLLKTKKAIDRYLKRSDIL